MLQRRDPPVYTRAEYLSDAAVHVAGITLALIAAPVVVTLAAVWIGDAAAITAVAIYAATLVAMLVCSALYNMIQRAEWRDRLRRIDQSAIYMKIAGAYTPFIALTAPKAALVLALVWTIALVGAAVIILARRQLLPLTVALYLGLGWIGVAFYGPALSGLSPLGLSLVVTAGVIYSAGVVFLLWQRLPFHNTIWHVFVMIASAVTYAAVLVEVARAAG